MHKLSMQNGSLTLGAAVLFSLLLSLGGLGSAAAYQLKTPEQFFDELHSLVNQIPAFAAENLSPTPIETTAVTESPAPEDDTGVPTPTPTLIQTESVSPTPTAAHYSVSSQSSEETRESDEGKIDKQNENDKDSYRDDDHEDVNGSVFLRLFR